MRYWELKNDLPDDEAELYIFGDIDPWGSEGQKNNPNRNASEIVQALQGLSAKHLTVHINSYGGDVKEGLAIYNTIKNSSMDVTTICDGFACSIASVIFMAGNNRIMNEASLLMIHNPWTIAIGNAEEMRKQADDLDIIAQASVEAYRANSCLLDDEIHALMDAETWILPEQALECGFATEVKKKPDEGLQQSAIRLIIDKLTAPVNQKDDDGDDGNDVSDEDIMSKLDAMDGKLDQLLASSAKAKAEPVPKQGTKKGFNLFF